MRRRAGVVGLGMVLWLVPSIAFGQRLQPPVPVKLPPKLPPVTAPPMVVPSRPILNAQPPANSPPWTFDTTLTMNGWQRGGSLAGDSVIRCPQTSPRMSDTLAATKSARELGGNYWSVPLPPDAHGCWLQTIPGTGEATTNEFLVAGRYLHLRVAGTPTTRVELHGAVGTGWLKLKEAMGDASGQMKNVVWDLEEVLGQPPPLLGKKIKLVLKDGSAQADLQVDSIRFSDAAVAGDPPPPVWGLADLHTHPFNQMAFGGKLFHGSIHPSLDRNGRWDDSWRGRGENPEARAMPQCSVIHGHAANGGTLIPFLEKGHHNEAFPSYQGWPHYSSTLHQQMYVDWLKRAWAGGVRVIHVDITNNHILGQVMANIPWLVERIQTNPNDDEWNIVNQVAAAKQFAQTPEVRGWAEIALTAEDARRIVSQGKLALVLGIEVEDFGSFTKNLVGKTPVQARQMIREYLTRLHQLGVRHVYPVHLTNNAFGGTAAYNLLFLVASWMDRGKPIDFRNGFTDGVRFRLDQIMPRPDNDFAALAKVIPDLARLRDGLRSYLLLPETAPLGHANALGLTANGRILIDELMRMGFTIDVDHMSELAVNETLGLVERFGYPVVSGHSGHLRDLAFGTWLFDGPMPVANTTKSFDPTKPDLFGTANPAFLAGERGRSGAQMERIRALKGVVGVGTGPAIAAISFVDLADESARVAQNCDGSTKSMAQLYLYTVAKMHGRGVALGTDMNGLADMVNPRFGTRACHAATADPEGRGRSLRGQVAAQQNGVRYASPRKHNFGRNWPGGPGESLDDWEAITWGAIERFEAGIVTDGPPERLNYGQQIARMAHAFHKAKTDPSFVRADDLGPGSRYDARIARQVFLDVQAGRQTTGDANAVRVRATWDAYHKTEGNNPPLVKSTSGDTDFDFNVDGLAHYGLIPDMLQDLRNIGLTPKDLAPLFRSAEDYIQMWENQQRLAPVIRAFPEP
jgi:microsomal dipeptidase-like Zn-dependent dipeptidase